jgi:hypothetical protein
MIDEASGGPMTLDEVVARSVLGAAEVREHLADPGCHQTPGSR